MNHPPLSTFNYGWDTLPSSAQMNCTRSFPIGQSAWLSSA
jgi:hypothetical protein